LTDSSLVATLIRVAIIKLDEPSIAKPAAPEIALKYASLVELCRKKSRKQEKASLFGCY
jgi:hypothetical protein